MTASDDPELARILTSLRLQLAEPIDFTSTDAESTIAKARVLSAAAKYFNVLAVTEFGGRIGPERHEGLVEQVVAAALLAVYYLDRVGYVLREPLATAEVVSLCRRVSAGEVRDLRLIAATLQAWTRPRR